MEKIPTAEELIDQFRKGFDGLLFETDTQRSIVGHLMIEFAKLHVERALKKAYEDACIENGNEESYINESSILTSYPLTNIK